MRICPQMHETVQTEQGSSLPRADRGCGALRHSPRVHGGSSLITADPSQPDTMTAPGQSSGMSADSTVDGQRRGRPAARAAAWTLRTPHAYGGWWTRLSRVEQVRQGHGEQMHCIVKGLEVLWVVPAVLAAAGVGVTAAPIRGEDGQLQEWDGQVCGSVVRRRCMEAASAGGWSRCAGGEAAAKACRNGAGGRGEGVQGRGGHDGECWVEGRAGLRWLIGGIR